MAVSDMDGREEGSMTGHTPGPWQAVVRSVGGCVHAFGGRGENCLGGHSVYSEFVEPLGIQLHGGDFDWSHATAKKGPPPSTADALLIAAAPELLAALHEIAITNDGKHAMRDIATRAIAKAEGR
jgi:hypothetical protein